MTMGLVSSLLYCDLYIIARRKRLVTTLCNYSGNEFGPLFIINLKFVLIGFTVFSYLEPKRQIGLPNTTVEVFCYANISNYEWEAVHLLYLNDSASQRMISVYQNETNTVIEKSINATIVNRDEIVNISFFISIKEQNSMCVKFSELACNFEFSDKDIETAYEKGTIEIIGNIIYSTNNYYFNFCVFFVKLQLSYCNWNMQCI